MLLELIRSRLRNREQTKVRYLNAGLLPAPEESTFSQADETFLLKLNKIIVENLDSSVLDIAFLCKEKMCIRDRPSTDHPDYCAIYLAGLPAYFRDVNWLSADNVRIDNKVVLNSSPEFHGDNASAVDQ